VSLDAAANLDLARVQFGTTTIYHFFFVPVTIGLAFLVAILQTTWHRSGNPEQRRLTRFFGTLLLINVAIGVVTGLVQEFEFGMNWSAYSRFVGDVFGAPLAMEGLAAFFLESTFLGLWIFGWDRLPKRVHLACIWLVAIGSVLSAAFIMAANSWMQHPVGYTVNSSTGRPQLNNVVALFTNPVFLWGYTHVLLASAVTGALIMLAVSAWHLRRGNSVDAFAGTAKLALVVLVPAIVLAMFVGSELGVVEAKYQPMKIAAAEAQWNTCQPCSFSLFQDRRRQGGRDAHPDPGDPPSALAAGHQSLERPGVGPQSGQRPVSAAVRARQLRPQRVHPVLVDAGHGLHRLSGLAVGAVGRLGGVATTTGAVQVVSAGRPLVRHRPLPDEHGRLVPDRKRAAALDRAGAHEDLGGRVPYGERGLDMDHPDCVHTRLRTVRGPRRGVDGPLWTEEPGRG
jgi:hypothetical protein